MERNLYMILSETQRGNLHRIDEATEEGGVRCVLLRGPSGSGKTSVLIKSGVVLVERMVQGAGSEEARPLLVVSSCMDQATTRPLMKQLDEATGGTGAEKVFLSWPDLLKHCGLARADFKTREG